MATMTNREATVAEALESIDTRLELAESQLRLQWQQYFLGEIGTTLESLDDLDRKLLTCKVAVKVKHHLYPPQKTEIWHHNKTTVDKTIVDPPSQARSRASLLIREASVAMAQTHVDRARGQMAEWVAAESRSAQAIAISRSMQETAIREIGRCGGELAAAERTLKIEQEALRSELAFSAPVDPNA
jgi:hypothetical protein